MQTLVTVHCRKGRSLREAIEADGRREATHGLKVVWAHKRGRHPGWLKLRSTVTGRPGAINIEWDGDASLLLCRVITRGGNRPHQILGDLIDYLMARHRRRIRFVVVTPESS